MGQLTSFFYFFYFFSCLPHLHDTPYTLLNKGLLSTQPNPTQPNCFTEGLNINRHFAFVRLHMIVLVMIPRIA